jgi:site-specific recombinase XerD
MNALASLLDDFLEEQRRLGRSPAHLRSLGYQVRAFLHWLGEHRGCLTAEELRVGDLEAWVRDQRQRLSIRGGPLKPASINKQIESVRGFLGWLASAGRLGATMADSLAYVAQPHLLPQSVLAHRQMRALLGRTDTGSLEGARDRAMWEVLYSSGVRSAELLGLNLGDIDLPNATALVMGKGSKQRMVPFGRTASRVLESYLKGVRPLLVRDAAEMAVWLNQGGHRVSYAMFRRRLRAHAGRLELPFPVTPHTFRRSCATELVRGGANLWHVKELLGHENLDTLQHYVRLTIADLKKTHARCHPRERDQR